MLILYFMKLVKNLPATESFMLRSCHGTETNVLFSSNHTDNKYKFCHFVTHFQRGSVSRGYHLRAGFVHLGLLLEGEIATVHGSLEVWPGVWRKFQTFRKTFSRPTVQQC